jgi:hypothetical protein
MILMVTGLKDMSRCQLVFELAWVSEAVKARQAAAFSIAASVWWWWEQQV